MKVSFDKENIDESNPNQTFDMCNNKHKNIYHVMNNRLIKYNVMCKQCLLLMLINKVQILQKTAKYCATNVKICKVQK